ncbi:hypothetical protein ACFQZ2_06360 [Streptomonospora algeriensis]|uniref:Uncharacterized protein n=1 Tax=Streptomonospora algeriensis TaxID=995084 RepID=A0ABW3B9C9_9ACTN
MAHHVPDPADEPPTGLFPQSTAWRAAIALIASAALCAAALALWATGGLARADTAPDQEPGTEVRTAMYTLTPHEAELVTGDDGLTALQVRAELVSEHTEPIPLSAIRQVIDVDFPSGRIEAPALTFGYVRHPDGLVFEVQPDMREEVLMTWSLRKAEAADRQKEQQEESDNPLAGLSGVSDRSEPVDLDSLMETPEDVAPLAEKEDEVTLTFHETEFSPGFTDQTKRWVPADAVAAEVSFPLGQG